MEHDMVPPSLNSIHLENLEYSYRFRSSIHQIISIIVNIFQMYFKYFKTGLRKIRTSPKKVPKWKFRPSNKMQLLFSVTHSDPSALGIPMSLIGYKLQPISYRAPYKHRSEVNGFIRSYPEHLFHIKSTVSFLRGLVELSAYGKYFAFERVKPLSRFWVFILRLGLDPDVSSKSFLKLISVD